MNIEALNYLAVLERTEFGVFQVNPEADGCTFSSAKVIRGSFAKVESLLSELNAAGGSVFIQVQGGRRRGEKHIRYAEWLYLDFDNVAQLPVLPFPPHMVVQTRSGFHVYWRIDATDRLRLWKSVTKKIREALNACSGVGSIGQVLRVPGFFHHKEDPFQVTIHSWDPNRPAYRLENFAERYDVSLEEEVETSDPGPSLAFNDLKSDYTNEIKREFFAIYMHELKRQVSLIREVQEGRRYTTVRNAAFCLGHYIHLGLEADRTFRKLLRTVERREWQDNDLTPEALRPIIASGLSEGYRDGSPYLRPEIMARLEHVDARIPYRERVAALVPTLPDKVTTQQVRELLGGRATLWATDKQESHQIGKILLQQGFQRRATRLKGQTIFLRRTASDLTSQASNAD